jgi:hypothetical protein
VGEWDKTRAKMSQLATVLASKILLTPCSDPMEYGAEATGLMDTKPILPVTRRFLRLNGVKFGAARGGQAFARSAQSRPLRPVPLTVKRPQFPLKKQNIYRLP